MKIKWVPLALADLEEAAGFISKDNPDAGRAGRVPGTRELIIGGTPFILPYRVKDDTLQVLRVLHSSRKWPVKFSS